jgi:hypothetical protein
MYPGQDQYQNAATRAQSGWWIRGTGPMDVNTQVAGQQGTYTIATGVFDLLSSSQQFGEYYSQSPDVDLDHGYAEGHALNCSNATGAYGWSTFWLDNDTLVAHNGAGAHKVAPETLMDEKSLSCTPNSLLAAFCAWDGGQLATAEVMDAITSNTTEAAYTFTNQNGKLAAAGGLTANCGNSTNTNPANEPASYDPTQDRLNSFSDGTLGCYNVWYYPQGDSNDDSGKIAMPGRVAADVTRVSASDEPWMDMVGNLEEVVLKRGETNRFDYRGFGLEYSSIVNHKLQQSTSRFRGGAFGARCMRFK